MVNPSNNRHIDDDNADDDTADDANDNNDNNHHHENDDIINNNHNHANDDDAPAEPAPVHNIDAAALEATPTCGIDPMPDLRVIPVRTCRTATYLWDPKACEHKGIIGVLVNLRTATGSGTARTVVNAGVARYSSGAGANSRQRVSNNLTPANYDRIMTFADCSSTNGVCFAFMTHTKTESSNFFKNLRVGQEGVGDLILLEEVDPVSDTLGSTTNVALIKECSHVLPLSGTMARMVPSVPLRAPNKGDTRYFCQHNVRSLQFGHVSIVQAICGGKLWYGAEQQTGNHSHRRDNFFLPFPLCPPFYPRLHSDRQLSSAGTGQSCGCFYKTERHNPLVIKMNVAFPVPRKFNADGKQTVLGFRSLRTSELLVALDGWTELDLEHPAHERALRQAVDRINRYINQRGGWTYIGWLRTGATADQTEPSLKDIDNISSLTQSPHISYLFPTDPRDIAEDNASFQRLRLHAADLMSP